MMWHSILAKTTSSFWLPEQASTVAPDVDNLFYFILWVCVFFSVLVIVLMIWFAWRYRQRAGNEEGGTTSHNNALEITWTVIPTIIVAVIYYWGFKGFLTNIVDPPTPYEVKAIGQMWKWSFQYPNGAISTELHVPLNVPVRVVLQSEDVIHSLFIPSFRVKRDVVPGRFNRLWFQATEKGAFDIFCAAYCGTNHSTMHSYVVVDDKDTFDKWLEDVSNPIAGKMSWIDGGRNTYERLGCIQCHTTNGAPLIGPSWKDMFGSDVPLSDGTTVKGDEAYVHESVLEPAAKIHRGFPNIMPSFKGRIKDQEIQALIWYMKSISSHVPSDQLKAGHEIVPKEKKK